MIIIKQCPECRTNKENIPSKQWKSVANPSCLRCKGSGCVEKDQEKRLELDRQIDEMLDQLDKIDPT